MASLMAVISENVFNMAYLITVWALALSMAKGLRKVSGSEKPLASRFLLAFILLAAGDSFHVGARVLTALMGTARTTVVVGGTSSSFLGLGMLVTAYTMTVFYMVLAEARSLRSGKGPDLAFWIMEILLGIRLVLMALPGNHWELAVPPYGMGLLRNLPLAAAGFLMAGLFVLEGRRDGDRAWAGIGWSMFASYAFYTVVILFADRVPALGLLMIPKTVAYVVMGFLAYRRWWSPRPAASRLSA